MGKYILIIEAADKHKGMDFQELDSAMSLARNRQCDHLGKVRVGFKGQIISIKFESNDVMSRRTQTFKMTAD